MATRELLDKIGQLSERPNNAPTPPPIEVVAFVVRWNRGLRQWKTSTLADFARVSISSVERVERGERVSDDVLDKIAQAFGYQPGYFTAPRIPLGTDEAIADLVETHGHLETVAVAPMTSHRVVRGATQCQALLIHRPLVPETYNHEIENLREMIDAASLALSDIVAWPSSSKPARRDLYNDIIAYIRELERRGLTVLCGVMPAPQEGFPDWKVAIISVSPKLTDPGAAKRRQIFVDRRLVASSCNWAVR